MSGDQCFPARLVFVWFRGEIHFLKSYSLSAVGAVNLWWKSWKYKSHRFTATGFRVDEVWADAISESLPATSIETEDDDSG